MNYTRETAISRLLESYRAYYNVIMSEESEIPLIAICEFYEHSEKYVLSRQANLWAANCEEFIYIFSVGHLTVEQFEKCCFAAGSGGIKKAYIGPGHRYT